jgi:hypothetical protein
MNLQCGELSIKPFHLLNDLEYFKIAIIFISFIDPLYFPNSGSKCIVDNNLHETFCILATNYWVNRKFMYLQVCLDNGLDFFKGSLQPGELIIAAYKKK